MPHFKPPPGLFPIRILQQEKRKKSVASHPNFQLSSTTSRALRAVFRVDESLLLNIHADCSLFIEITSYMVHRTFSSGIHR
jgi:hypothetical protein